MKALLDTFPFPFHLAEAQQLHLTICQVHPTVQSAIAMAERVGLPAYMIDPGQPVFYVWREILKETTNQGMLRTLVEEINARLNEMSPFKPFFNALIQNMQPIFGLEPVDNSGEPAFIKSNDHITDPEALLYLDDLTLQIGKLPQLVIVLQRMIELAPSVCKLVVDINGLSQAGTAFRIGEDMLLTNWHVVHNKDGSMRATTVTAEFGYEDNGTGGILTALPLVCDVSTIVSERQNDWAIIRTTSPMNSAWPIIKLSAAANPVLNAPAYIIQHPLGNRKRIGFVRNQVSAFDNDVVHYLTDTQEGSSGAPVFNGSGELIALHHAGGRPQEVVGRTPMKKNEGIRISKITYALHTMQIAFM